MAGLGLSFFYLIMAWHGVIVPPPQDMVDKLEAAAKADKRALERANEQAACVPDLTSQITSLSSKLNDASIELATSKSRGSVSASEAGTLRAQVDVLSAQLGATQAEVTSACVLHVTVAELTARLEEATRQRVGAEANADELSKRLERAEASLAAMQVRPCLQKSCACLLVQCVAVFVCWCLGVVLLVPTSCLRS